LVSEYFALGPLDAYLRINKDKISFSNLVEAATYIATALWDMVIYLYLYIEKFLSINYIYVDLKLFTIESVKYKNNFY